MADEELPSYTPQHVQDILPIYANATNPLETYILTQTSPSTQVLHLQSHEGSTQDGGTTYFIKTFATGGFLNKKPHVVISKTVASPPPIDADDVNPQPPPRRRSLFRRSPSPPKDGSTSSSAAKTPPPTTCAEARFDIHGTGTSISYTSPSPPVLGSTAAQQSNLPRVPQRLELTNSSMQILRTTVGRGVYYWQEHPGNRAVYEFVDESEELLARFVYLNIPWLIGPSSSSTGPRRSSSTTDAALTPMASVQSAGSAEEGGADAGKKSKSDNNGSNGKNGEYEIGRLEIVGSKIEGQVEREEVLCSALVVIERAKRRAVNLGLFDGGGKAKGEVGGPRIRGYS